MRWASVWAQQESRGDVDFELPECPFPVRLTYRRRKASARSTMGLAALPALQQRLVEGEEDAFLRTAPAREAMGPLPVMSGGVSFSPLARRNQVSAMISFRLVHRDKLGNGARRAPGDARFQPVPAFFPAARVVLGNEVLVFPEVGDLLDEGPVFVRQEVVHCDRPPIQGIASLDFPPWPSRSPRECSETRRRTA